MDVALWIDENRAFLDEVVEVLAPFATVPSVVQLLYRYRGYPPQRFLPMVEDEDVLPPAEESVTTPLLAEPVHPKAVAGMSWNKVASMEAVPEPPKPEETVPEEPDEETLKARLMKDTLAREKAFEDETHNNELLLEVLEEIKEIATRHNCCYGIHSNSFLYALGDLVGA